MDYVLISEKIAHFKMGDDSPDDMPPSVLWVSSGDAAALGTWTRPLLLTG